MICRRNSVVFQESRITNPSPVGTITAQEAGSEGTFRSVIWCLSVMPNSIHGKRCTPPRAHDGMSEREDGTTT